MKHVLNAYKQAGGLILSYTPGKGVTSRHGSARLGSFLRSFFETEAPRARAPPSGLCRHKQSIIYT